MKEKWEALSWKQKNGVFCIVLLAFGWLAWHATISRTFDLHEECSELIKGNDSAQFMSLEIAELELQLDSLNHLSDDVKYVTHEELLGTISNYCSDHALKLREYPEVRRVESSEHMIEIHQAVVEGNFKDLVLLAEEIRNEKSGRIVSLRFTTRVDNKTKMRSLQATYYVECIRNTGT